MLSLKLVFCRLILGFTNSSKWWNCAGKSLEKLINEGWSSSANSWHKLWKAPWCSRLSNQVWLHNFPFLLRRRFHRCSSRTIVITAAKFCLRLKGISAKNGISIWGWGNFSQDCNQSVQRDANCTFAIQRILSGQTFYKCRPSKRKHGSLRRGERTTYKGLHFFRNNEMNFATNQTQRTCAMWYRKGYEERINPKEFIRLG